MLIFTSHIDTIRKVESHPLYRYGGFRKPRPSEPAPALRTSGLAIAAVVLGLIGVFPASIPLGFAALAGMRRQRHQQGRGFAIAGIVLGLLYAPIWAFAAWVGLTAYSNSRSGFGSPIVSHQQARDQTCAVTVTGQGGASLTLVFFGPMPGRVDVHQQCQDRVASSNAGTSTTAQPVAAGDVAGANVCEAYDQAGGWGYRVVATRPNAWFGLAFCRSLRVSLNPDHSSWDYQGP